MSTRVFRLKGFAQGARVGGRDIELTFSTQETDMEKVWAQARREAKKHVGLKASISIQSLKEIV